MINDIQSLLTAIDGGSRPLVLFSGGLDGAFLISSIRNTFLVALTVDLGGDPIGGAAHAFCEQMNKRHVVVDARLRFAENFVKPAILAHATNESQYPICASLSRPLMAQIAIEVAREEGCDLIVHTANSSQNSLRRFNTALAQLGFDGDYGSPFAESSFSRIQKCQQLSAEGFSSYGSRSVSLDSNFWGREFEGGPLDDPESITISEDLYVWTHTQCRATTSETLNIRFESGLPTHVDGRKMDLVSLVSVLNTTVGRHGVGRYVGMEEVRSGNKVQEVREMPAATILFDALRRLESASLPYGCHLERVIIENSLSREAVEGRWFGDLRPACQAFLETLSHRVTGIVKYILGDGTFEPLSVKADHPLYVRDRTILETRRSHSA